MGARPRSTPEMLDRPVRQRALVLVGVDQVTVGEHVERRCALALPGAIGPFWLRDAGHFLPWERPETSPAPSPPSAATWWRSILGTRYA